MSKYKTVQAKDLNTDDSFKFLGATTIHKIKSIYKGDFLQEPGNVLFILENCKQLEMKLTDYLIYVIP